MGDDSSEEQGKANIPTLVQGAAYKDYTSKQKLPEEAPPAPRSAGQPDALPWEPTGPQGTASLLERTEAPLPPRPQCNFIHPKLLSPFPECLGLPFPSEEILSGFENIVPSGTDQFTAWVKTDPDASLVRWSKPLQIFARHQKGDTIHLLRHTASAKKLSNRAPVQKRLSIYNWNPGPRRGEADRRQVARHHFTRSI